MLAVFHVSLAGNDGNDGSAANPYRTIQTAITAASLADDGDDIIRVQGGDYNVAGVDLGFSINSDAELDTLDIVGGFDAAFAVRDLINTPTNYTPQNAGGQIVVGDDDATIDGINFQFDGTNSGVVLAASNVTLTDVNISNATEGVVGDGLTGSVNITNSVIHGNSNTGVQLTNQTGDLLVNGSTISSNGNHGIDFEGSSAFVSIQTSTLASNSNGVGARIINPGGQVAFGNNGSVTLNGAGIVVNQATSLAIDAMVVDSNTLNGLSATDVGTVDLTGNTSFSSNGFIGARITNAGSLTVNNIDVNLNLAGGLIASNTTGDVKITNSNFGENSTGIGIEGAATLAITGSTATLSTSANGLYVNAVVGKVEVLGGDYSSNAADGVHITNSLNDVILDGFEASDNAEQGFDVNGAESIELNNLVLKNNVSGVGGQVDGVPQIYFNSTTVGVVADLVEVTGSSITHTRAGDAQQPINYANASRLSISTHDGDDTIQVNGAFTLGAVGGLHILAGEGNDLMESNAVSGFGQTVPLIFRGEAGSDSLAVNTFANTDDRVTLESQFVYVQYGPNAQAATPEVHEYEQTEQISITTAGGNDSIIVTEPIPNGEFPGIVNIHGGDQNDGFEINLGRHGSNTTYNIDGGTGTNGLTIFTRSANDNVLVFNPGVVEVLLRVPPDLSIQKTINFANVLGINALAAAGDDTFHVNSSDLGAGLKRLSLYGQMDDDIVNVTLSHPTLSLFLQVDGGGGIDNRLNIDTDNDERDNVTVDSQRVLARLGPNPMSNPIQEIQYANLRALRVATFFGADTVTLSQAVAAPNLPVALTIETEDGDDQIVVNPVNIPNSVELHLNLGAGNDTVTANLSATPIHTTLFVDGGDDAGDLVQVMGHSTASNVISAGAFVSGDRVRLRNVELLFMLGGAGNDVFTNNTAVNSLLNGLNGNDQLTGGAGRDFILGGGGLDSLAAVSEEDLLLSGPVSFASRLHILSLLAIMSEWTSARPFDERVANINGTGVGPRNNGDTFLQVGVTVFDEGALDTLSGGIDADWFFARTSIDQILDQQALEDILTNIP